jgi:FkbM family methyltransferase
MDTKPDIANYNPPIIPERIFNRYLAFFGLFNGNLSLKEFLPALFLSGKQRSKEVSRKRDEARLAYWKKSISKFLNDDGSITLFSHPFYTVSENYGELTSLLKDMIIHDQYATKEFVKDGDVIIDAGANIGMFCVKAAHDFPHATIYAFEPSARTFAVLKKNAAPYPNIICINRGLGDTEELKSMTQIDLGAAGGRLDDSPMGALQSPWEKLISETASITTIDAAAKEKVDFIKIDTEGYEAKILSGATETIKKYRPVIAMSAYHNAHDKEELPKLLKSICPEYICELRRDSEEDLICRISTGK